MYIYIYICVCLLTDILQFWILFSFAVKVNIIFNYIHFHGRWQIYIDIDIDIDVCRQRTIEFRTVKCLLTDLYFKNVSAILIDNVILHCTCTFVSGFVVLAYLWICRTDSDLVVVETRRGDQSDIWLFITDCEICWIKCYIINLLHGMWTI